MINSVGLYDFHDAEKVDGIIKLNQQNEIQIKTQNLTEYTRLGE